MVKEGKISREDFEAFKIGVERLKELQRELNSLNTKKFKSDADAIRVKLKNVSEIPNIERGIKILKLKIANKYKPVKKRRGGGGSAAVSGISNDIKDIKKDLEQNLPEIKSAIKKLGKKVEDFKDQGQDLSLKIIPVNLKRKLRKNRKRKSNQKKVKIQSEMKRKRKNRKNKVRRKKAKVAKIKKAKIVKKIKPTKKVKHKKFVRKLKAPEAKKKKIRRHRKRASSVKSKVKQKKAVKKSSESTGNNDIKNKIIKILANKKALSLNQIKKKLGKIGIKKGKREIVKYLKMIEKEGKIKEVKR
jgi:hypothetical protein